MLVHPRTTTILFVFFAAVSPAIAGGKAAPKSSLAPAVPGFARFYSDAKADVAEGGRLLLGELQCARCHAASVDQKLGVAPILDGVGARIKVSYLRRFISDPHKTKPGTKMPDFFAGLDADDKKAKVEALVHLLASTGTPTQIRPDTKGIASGRHLYAKVGCVSCHGTRDAKGDQDVVFATSVPLGNLKAKYTIASIKAFLENPHQTRPDGRMPGLLNAKEASDVANYLLQGTAPGGAVLNMNYSYYEGDDYQVLPDFTKVKPKATGQTVDFDLSVKQRLNDCAIKFDGFLKIDKAGTYTFRTTSDDGSKLWIDGKLIVNNDGVHAPATRSGKAKLAKGMHDLAVGVFNAGAGFELSCDIEGNGLMRQPLGPLVYLTEEGAKPKAVVENDADDFRVEPKLVAQGKELFVSTGCANCHQLQNEKKRMSAPALANLKLDAGCLQAAPKKGVPQYHLSAVQQLALQSALKAPLEKADAKATATQTMVQFNCYACHERDKIGGVEEELNKYFQTVQPEMGDEGRIPPSLTGVGAKLNTAYLKKILSEGSHDRPYMYTRMPKFGSANVGHLVELYASLDPAEPAPQVVTKEPMAKLKAAGRDMVGTKFGCIKCHTFAGNKAEGVQGIDMAIMTQRLKKDWFHNYMNDPSKYRPGTRMPASFPDGKTLLKKVLDGTAPTQIEAIWAYLAAGKSAVLPAGMNNKGSIALVPTTEAIIYRNFIQGAGPRAIGVGFPEKAHYAFDANELRLAMIWQGAFMDARRHWTDRGVGFEPPMGDNIMHLPAGPSFFVLSKDDEAWPTKAPKELGYKFRGYRLSDDQRPTLLYSFNDIDIEDFPNAIETPANPGIRRTLMLTTANPIDKLYYRAAVADKIEADKDGWFRINDWRMRIESDQAPVIRPAGSKMELLVPVRFKGKGAKIVQEYVW